MGKALTALAIFGTLAAISGSSLLVSYINENSILILAIVAALGLLISYFVIFGQISKAYENKKKNAIRQKTHVLSKPTYGDRRAFVLFMSSRIYSHFTPEQQKLLLYSFVEAVWGKEAREEYLEAIKSMK